MILKLLILLFVLMVLVGGNRGLDSFLALARTVIAFIVNVYLITWGMPPLFTTFLVSVFFVITVLYSQNGKNVKMDAAVMAVTLVLFVIALTSGPILWRAGMSGYNEVEQYEEISMYLSPNLAIPMSAVSLSAVMLGLLGAIMDTAVAITTAVHEVYVNQKDLSEKQLVQSGMTVGRDILGTTVNTLFFAGLGESIMLAVLFMKNEDTVSVILNSKALFQEVSGIAIGAIGCLLIIPLSSILIAHFLKNSEENGSKKPDLLQKCYNYIKKHLKNIKKMVQ